MANRGKLLIILGTVLLVGLTITGLTVYDYIFGIGAPPTAITPLPGTKIAPEQTIRLIPLQGPIANSQAELSGLAWYGETLILLPQYPDRFGNEDGAIFALHKSEILTYVEDKSTDPLQPFEFPLITGGLENEIRGFEGYEAIIFDGERVYMTIEARSGGKMHGYIVSGEIMANLSELRLQSETLTEIPMPVQIGNKSDEAIFQINDRLFTLYEINGEAFTPEPLAYCFTLELVPCPSVSFPRLEYRLTDASAVDELGRFWVINYQFPGDINIIPKNDPLVNQYGRGATHMASNSVERLVEYQYTDGGIQRTDRAPIQLQLGAESRNWEGIVRLDSLGFLLVTDKYPGTVLGFVQMPNE